MKKAQLFAKLVLFTVGIFWTMFFLYVSIISFDFFRDIVYTYGEIDMDNWFMTVMEVWYLVTCLAIGIYSAKKAFSVVAIWEKETDEPNGIEEVDTGSN